ncbi:hypothetical protein CB293_23310 [Salmonella enterica subsp. enterica serovar Kentucky]|nr:hypothetical protein [Salmonella enterica subsp. enterica serovar Kentucky]
MNKHLGLIIQSIVNKTRYKGEEDVPIDNICSLFNEMDEGCEDVYCHDCILGYKNKQQYTSQIIKVWRQL